MNKIFTYRFLIIILLSFASYQFSYAALCTSNGNGAWNNAATWSCGHVPACGDSVVIKAGSTVTVTVQQDYSACASGPNIVIYGTLKFDNGNKLKLPCNARIYIMSGGSIAPGSGGGNSNYIEICGDILWNAAAGTLTGPSCLPANAPWCLGVVLPIELTSFTGDAKDGYVDLSWITATEQNSSHYEVERAVNPNSFQKIATIKSKSINGNSNTTLYYTHTDNDPLDNTSYYRLKHVNKDLTFSLSKMISVNYIKSKNIKFVVYPNPNHGEFMADISEIENNHEIQIVLTDEIGNRVYSSNFFVQENSTNKFQIIPKNQLANGIYTCTLILEGIEYNVKVVVN